jgi:hypothetical protein
MVRIFAEIIIKKGIGKYKNPLRTTSGLAQAGLITKLQLYKYT